MRTRRWMVAVATAAGVALRAYADLAGLLLWYAAREQLQVCIDHAVHELFEADTRLPAEHGSGLGAVTHQPVDFSGTHEHGVASHIFDWIQADAGEGDVDELPHTMRHTRRDHEVFGLGLLQHEPHSFDIVCGVAP